MVDKTYLESHESIQAYLDRIGFEGPARIDYDTLARLQWAHVHAVPYENLDILNGKYISIEIPDVYDKIVRRRRGGYCFELNGLFSWLLRRLGFQVTEYYGRYLEGEPLEMPMRRHRIARVDLDGKIYIADVGMGVSAPRNPLLFQPDLEQKQGGESYRIVRHPTLGWVVQYLHKGEYERLFCFTEDPQYPIDFEMPNHWCMTHLDSIFRNNTMVFIRTPEGRNTIADKLDGNGRKVQEFRRFTTDGVVTCIPKSKKEYKHALLSHFGIVL
jgi:arylamine N-acetyltransferase